MKSILPTICCLAAGLLLAACSRPAPAPPQPIAVDQTPAKLEEAFKQKQAQAQAVAAEVQRLLDDAVASLKARDFGKAVFALQALLGRSDLSAEQRDVASRSLLAANQALADQASSGDKRAQEMLQYRRATK